ncbi:hypothetical protein JCM11641_007675 [Rhodosporidiobolus odoratus]
MSVRLTQKYGPVVTQDLALSDSDLEKPTFSSSPATPPALSHPLGLQQALDSTPPPAHVSTATIWLVRAFPILATLSWLATLLVLLGIWLWVDDQVKYKWYLGGMPYLSDVGADNKTIFLFGNISTAVFYVMSLLSERMLRAKRVMVEATEERHLWVAVGALDVFVGLLGGIALVLLAIFDAFDFPALHNAFMTSFIVCVTLSGLLQTVEVEHLWHEHPDRHDLRDGTILKWIVLLLSSACGISFWLLYAACDGDATKEPVDRCYRLTTASAIMEWAACFGCAAYLATLILDVWPPHRHSPPTPVVWADRTGVRGIWITSPSSSFASASEATIPVHLPEHLSLHRPPFHAGEAEQGKRCAVVLVQGKRGMRPIAKEDVAAATSRDPGDDGYAFAWYSEGKRQKRQKSQSSGRMAR